MPAESSALATASREALPTERARKPAADKRSYIKINASKGTVVCTGGYARNEEMLKTLQPQTLNKYSLSIAIDGTTGDGIKACLWAGAHMDEVHTAMVFGRVAVKPDELGGSETTGSLFWMGSNPWLKVNLNGERFTNEAAPYDYILNSTLTQPGHTVVDIWDSDYEKYLEQFDIHGCARVFPFDNGAPTNMTLEAVKGLMQIAAERIYARPNALSSKELLGLIGESKAQ